MTIFRPLLVLLLLSVAQRLPAQDTKLGGFAQMEFEGTDRSRDRWSFALDKFDIYITSRLSDRISFLTELVFEFTDDAFITDVERVIVTFTPKTYFRVSVGKFHTPIGYFNTTYHDGTLLQPTIDRPLVFVHEDDGGILQLHTVGMQIEGRDISPLHLSYKVAVGNGIGSTPRLDNDNAKAYTFALHSQITSALRLGASLYVDRIAAGTRNLAGLPVTQDLREQVAGGFAVYRRVPWEVAGEWQRATHRTASGSRSNTDGFYLYAGYQVHRVTPYARYEGLRYPAADLYYVVNDARLAIVGTRYDFAPTAALKLELRRRHTALGGTSTEAEIQVAVGF